MEQKRKWTLREVERFALGHTAWSGLGPSWYLQTITSALGSLRHRSRIMDQIMTDSLGERRQVIMPLWASVSPFIKWG